jgi:hypothetical protein
MGGPRSGRFGLLKILLVLLIAVAVAGVVVVPRVAPSLLAPNGPLARAKRKFLALRAFALFRAPGDRAVLRAGDPPPRRASRH